MRVAIIGNSGSGKSSLARKLAADGNVSVLDLDKIYWSRIAVKRDDAAALADLDAFCAGDSWIVEGCYGNLIQHALESWPELIFMNPGEAACLANCRNRPWEPHKYPSKMEQDSRLEFLLQWVSEYYTRDDDMSLRGHRTVFDSYQGPKREITRQNSSRVSGLPFGGFAHLAVGIVQQFLQRFL